MANTMQFDLVSPERSLASLQATAVQIPGADGDMTAMPDHSPLITTLRPGILSVTSAEGTADYVVTGGFAEISGEGTSVLAEKAMPAKEVQAAEIDTLIAEAQAQADGAAADTKDASDKLLADLQQLKASLGL